MDEETYRRLTKEERLTMVCEFFGETMAERKKRHEAMERRESLRVFLEETEAYSEAFKKEHGFEPFRID